MNGYITCNRKRVLFALSILFTVECYLNISVYLKHNTRSSKVFHTIKTAGNKSVNFYCNITDCNITVEEATVLAQTTTEKLIVYYKYPLINSTDVSMEFINGCNSSYNWFISMKHLFKKIGEEDTPRFLKEMPVCQLNQSTLGPINVNKAKRDLKSVEKQNPDVKLGGSHTPAHCNAKHRVAVIVPYRDRRINFIIFLHYIHPLLKKQLLNYRIFVIEQYGIEKFNKGTLYNIAFLETQRFGTWHCLIFHDVDLIPEDERISYSCSAHPTHMATSVESFNYVLPYPEIFGGVTALTPAQYETINGYSNYYWNWGGEDDDIYRRILAKNYTVVHYNSSIARYATLPHPETERGNERKLFLMLSRLHFLKEGLLTTKYNLIRVTEEKLYTYILADVNPTRMKLDTKSLMQHIINFHGKSMEYGRQELKLRGISAKALRQYLRLQRLKQESQTTYTLSMGPVNTNV